MHLEGRIHKGFELLRNELTRLRTRKEYLKKLEEDLKRKKKHSHSHSRSRSRSQSKDKKKRNRKTSKKR